jgi:hypothetical protein
MESIISTVVKPKAKRCCSNCREEGHTSPNCKNPHVEKPTSKNSQTAKSGFAAETILCNSPDVLDKLGEHFGKRVVKCEKINGRKKSDIVTTFEDGSKFISQVKNGTGGGRGWSIDRRALDNLPICADAKDLLKVVCLDRNGGERKIVPNDKELISKLLLGEDEVHKPQYFIHTTVKDRKITSLSICPAPLFIETLLKGVYETFHGIRTGVHLSPLMYLQRKGGGKTDHSPDDIQAKLKKMPDCMTEIKLD